MTKLFYSWAVIQIFRIHNTARNRPKSKPSFGDLHSPCRASSYPATVNGKARANWRARSLWIQMIAASNARFYGRIIERSLALACIQSQIKTRHVSGEVCVWMVQAARAFTSSLREDQENSLDNIFRINNINSALHHTQTCCIPPEMTATAMHRHLDYFWYMLLTFSQ